MKPTSRFNYSIFDGRDAGGAPVTTGREECGELHAFFPAGGGIRGLKDGIRAVMDELEIGEAQL